MTTELVPRHETEGLVRRYELTVDEVIAQVTKIQTLMEKVMREGEHYGVIPGTDKPTLFKPGAEKLCFTFRLDPQYEVMSETVREPDFISYTARCTLWHIPSGQRIASGMGSCNSREAKYRYRYVPTEQKPDKAEAARLKAAGLGRWRKQGEAWVWVERIEHDNPWDHDNTLLKMASKRALVAAVLNATAASDIFTQDLEDYPEGMVPTTNGKLEPTSTQGPSTQGMVEAELMPRRKSEPKEPTTAQGTLTFEIQGRTVTTAGITKETLLTAYTLGEKLDKYQKGKAKEILGREMGVEHRHELTEAQGKVYVAALAEALNQYAKEKK